MAREVVVWEHDPEPRLGLVQILEENRSRPKLKEDIRRPSSGRVVEGILPFLYERGLLAPQSSKYSHLFQKSFIHA